MAESGCKSIIEHAFWVKGAFDFDDTIGIDDGESKRCFDGKRRESEKILNFFKVFSRHQQKMSVVARCQSFLHTENFHHSAMKSLSYLRSTRGLAALLGLLSASAIITSCSSGSSGSMAGAGHGPFDSRGNYVEAWADNPEMWKGRSNSSPSLDAQPEPIMLAANDTPPASMTSVASAPTRSATVSTASIKPRTSTTSVSTKPRTTVAKTTVKPKTVASKSRNSSSSRVMVKKGDTLYGLALRHKSSVSAIQKANGMRDTKLSVGRSLVIPRI
jgi:LysM repeat protein